MQPLIWIGEVTDGRFTVVNRDLFFQGVSQFSGPVEIEIRHTRDQRTTKQNAYLWGVVYKMVAEDVGEDDPNNIHKEYTKMFLTEIVWSKLQNEEVERVKSTTDLSKDGFWEYVEKIQRHAAIFLHLNIPDPNQD